MISRENFHRVYQQLPIHDLKAEEYLYSLLKDVTERLIKKSRNHPKVLYNEQLIFDYIIQEFLYMLQGRGPDNLESIIGDENFRNQFVSIVTDKFFFNEITPYHAVSLVSHQSPVISTMELNINFILNRISAIKKNSSQKDILIDMLSKVFLMFKSVNYLLSSGFETEAFSTWRTIHELECVIKIINDYPHLIPVYLRHIVYNNAFRDEFEDKEEQQKTIDELKFHMKEHGLKSKDMKKYIEYGWLYSIRDVEKNVENFKLNFRNGLEAVAGLERYSQDYEMSSEVAHSSPLLIYSNKPFFKSITIVRSYESFLRLEEIFYSVLLSYENVDKAPYENMRKLYLEFSKTILNREIFALNQLVELNLKKRNRQE